MADSRTAKRRRSDASAASVNAAYGITAQPVASPLNQIVPPTIQLKAAPAGNRSAAAARGSVGAPVLVGTPPSLGVSLESSAESMTPTAVSASESASSGIVQPAAMSAVTAVIADIESYVKAHASVVRSYLFLRTSPI